MFNVRTGAATVPTVAIKSTTPYSVVVRAFVYSGIRKKEINFDPRFPNVKIIVFFIK
jgi:hypothetical protein